MATGKILALTFLWSFRTPEGDRGDAPLSVNITICYSNKALKTYRLALRGHIYTPIIERLLSRLKHNHPYLNMPAPYQTLIHGLISLP